MDSRLRGYDTVFKKVESAKNVLLSLISQVTQKISAKIRAIRGKNQNNPNSRAWATASVRRATPSLP